MFQRNSKGNQEGKSARGRGVGRLLFRCVELDVICAGGFCLFLRDVERYGDVMDMMSVCMILEVFAPDFFGLEFFI